MKSVSMVDWNSWALEIELNTIFVDRDSQPKVSWDLIQALAPAFAEVNKEDMETIAGVPFTLVLTTYSVDGDSRSQSFTDHDTLLKTANKSISSSEWVKAAKAGFK